MHRYIAVVVLVAVGVLVTGAGVSSGARQQTVTCGDEIDERGNYVVAGDCTAGTLNGIVINADDVILDLDGHTITAGVPGGSGILIDGDNVHLNGPGTIDGGSEGFFNGVLVRSTKSVVTRVTTTHNNVGIRVAGFGTVVGTDNRIVNNTSLQNFQRDLLDQNPNCDQNTWVSNVFGTANQSCIK
jgi:hypothetical protein